MEKKLFNDINVYNVNAEKRNGAGFPYDDEGNKKIVSLNGKWKFKYAKKNRGYPRKLLCGGLRRVEFRRNNRAVQLADRRVRQTAIS